MPQAASQATIKRLRALTRKKERARQGLLIVEGPRLVADVLDSRWPVRLVACTEDAADTEMMRVIGARAGQVEVVSLPRRDWLSLSETETPAEVLAVVEHRLRTFTPDAFASEMNAQASPALDAQDRGRWRRVLVLDGVSDPGNAGTLVRAAAAFGWQAVIALTDTVELCNPKVVRAAAGALWRVPVFVGAAHEELAAGLRAARFSLVIADLNGDLDGFAWRPEGDAALVLGSEAHGPRLRSDDAHRVRLPMTSGVESLNVAMAGTALMALWTQGRAPCGH